MVKHCSQVHANEPSVLIHFASEWQLRVLAEHSLIFVKTKVMNGRFTANLRADNGGLKVKFRVVFQGLYQLFCRYNSELSFRKYTHPCTDFLHKRELMKFIVL